MAYGKKRSMRMRKRSKRSRRTRRSRKGRGRKVTGKKLLRHALKPGIQSAAELAVRIIAKKEALKLLPPNLLFRRYVYGGFKREQNSFANGTRLSLNGCPLFHCAEIPMWDIQTVLAVAPAPDVALTQNYPLGVPVYERGANLLAAGIDPFGNTAVPSGFRTSTRISIKNFSVRLRFVLNPSRVLAASAPTEYSSVRYRLVAVSHPDMYQTGWAPEIEQVLPQKGFGYSSRIDTEVRDEKAHLKQKVLAAGSIRLRRREFEPQEEYRKLFWKGSLPYEYQGSDPNAPGGPQFLDQNGQNVTGKWKVFLCIRGSDTPVPTGGDTDHLPQVWGVVKTGFKNLM